MYYVVMYVHTYRHTQVRRMAAMDSESGNAVEWKERKAMGLRDSLAHMDNLVCSDRPFRDVQNSPRDVVVLCCCAAMARSWLALCCPSNTFLDWICKPRLQQVPKSMTVFHAVPNSRARPTYSTISNDNFRKLMDL